MDDRSAAPSSSTSTAPLTDEERQRVLDERGKAVLTRIAERKGLAPEQFTSQHYTTDDLKLVPPCDICGAGARIENGRIVMSCTAEKHRPKVFTPPALVKLPVQRTFEEDAGEEWWKR